MLNAHFHSWDRYTESLNGPASIEVLNVTNWEIDMDKNFERLASHILPLSNSKDFNVARTEWVLVGVEVSEEFD